MPSTGLSVRASCRSGSSMRSRLSQVSPQISSLGLRYTSGDTSCPPVKSSPSQREASCARNGLIVPKQNEEALYEAMRRLTTDRELTVQMAASAREMVATRFRQEDVWEALLRMYKNL